MEKISGFGEGELKAERMWFVSNDVTPSPCKTIPNARRSKDTRFMISGHNYIVFSFWHFFIIFILINLAVFHMKRIMRF